MILTKSVIFVWVNQPDGRNVAAIDAKLAEMAADNKTDGETHHITNLITKRNFVDVDAAQEFVDFYIALLNVSDYTPILTISIEDNV